MSRLPARAAVVTGLAANPAVSLTALRPLLEADPGRLTLIAFADREDLTEEWVLTLARRPDPLLAAGLARNPVAVRYAANPALPLPEIIRLLHLPDPRAAEAAARNPALPADVAAELIAT